MFRGIILTKQIIVFMPSQLCNNTHKCSTQKVSAIFSKTAFIHFIQSLKVFTAKQIIQLKMEALKASSLWWSGIQ